MKFLVALVFCNIISSRGTAQLFQNTDLTELRADSVSINIDSILIISHGPSIARIFLEEVGNRMIEILNHKKIAAQYLYAGKTARDVKTYFNRFNKEGYKAILFFSPIDTSFIDTEHTVNSTTGTGPNGPVAIYIPRSRMIYQQTFAVKLCSTNNGIQPFWLATAFIDCDPTKKSGARRISNKLIDRFEQNHYIP